MIVNDGIESSAGGMQPNSRTVLLNFLVIIFYSNFQILPHTNSYFHRYYSSLDHLPPGAPGVPQGGKALLVPQEPPEKL